MKNLKSVFCVLSAAILLFGLASCSVPIDTSPTSSVEEDDGPAEEHGPFITVFTEFPTGVVYRGFVDIGYDATPSKGAVITEVNYFHNGSHCSAIYLADGYGYPPNGELGKARIPLFVGENNISFEVEDSNGNTARFEVENKPYYESVIYDPKYDPEKFVLKEGTNDIYYLVDRLEIMAEEDAAYADVEKAVSSINGVITGYDFENDYYVQVPDSTWDELTDMCNYLMDEYSDIILAATYVAKGVCIAVNCATITNDSQ